LPLDFSSEENLQRRFTFVIQREEIFPTTGLRHAIYMYISKWRIVKIY